MNNALTARADRAKCAGVKCSYKESCGRYLRPEAENQTWASFYALADVDCDHFEPTTVRGEGGVSNEPN